jgi:hypothetical protein
MQGAICREALWCYAPFWELRSRFVTQMIARFGALRSRNAWGLVGPNGRARWTLGLETPVAAAILAVVGCREGDPSHR